MVEIIRVLLFIILIHYITTLEPKQTSWSGSSFRWRNVGWESVLPTNHVGHQNSSRQRPFPTNISLRPNVGHQYLNVKQTVHIVINGMSYEVFWS
jgi:hypothetical protein